MTDHRTRLRDAIERERRRRPASCPLRVTSNGQWAKNVHGKRRTFGSVLDVSRDEAVARFHRYMSDVGVGRDPRPIDADRVTVNRVIEAFMSDAIDRADSGAITAKTLSTMVRRCREGAAALGPHRAVDSLSPRDFKLGVERLLASQSPSTVGLVVSQLRSAFKWAAEVDRMIDRLPDYGTHWKKPAPRVIRVARRTRGFDGRRHFHAEEIAAVLEVASPMLRVCILLGVSAGMNAADIATLRVGSVDLGRDWIDDIRVKTGIPRRAPVWPELRAAVDAWRDADERRGSPRAAGAEGLLVVTRGGFPVVRRDFTVTEDGKGQDHETNAVGLAFKRALDRSGVRRLDEDGRVVGARGIGFSTLRRTCATFADAAGDRLAKARIMAHAADSDVDDSYVDHISDERLERVSSVVRAAVFPGAIVEHGDQSVDR